MNRVKNIIKVILFILIFCIMFEKVTYVLKNKEATWSITPVYNERKLDVIFLGSSTTQWGIMPMRLWEEYGIVSYNLGCPGAHARSKYYLAKDCIKRFSPKVIVVDTSTPNVEDELEEWELHYTLDNMKISLAKLQALSTIGPKFRWELIFNIIKFHSAWKEVNSDSFVEHNKPLNDKGAFYVNVLYHNENEDVSEEPMDMLQYDYPPILSSTNEEVEIKAKTQYYIDKTIELCKENGIELVFISMPSTREEWKKEANSIKKIMEEKNMNYLNFFDLAEVINLNVLEDMEHSIHVNVNGAKKVTSYIGKYLINKGYVEDRRNDPEFYEWHNYYENSIYKELYSDIVDN